MYVINRKGERELLHLDKITARIRKLTYGLSTLINPEDITKKVKRGIFSDIKTTELDRLSAEISASMTSLHYDFSILAARIELSNMYRSVSKYFSVSISNLYHNLHPRLNTPAPLISKEVYEFVMKNANELDGAIVHDRDKFDYFGFYTLDNMILMRNSKNQVAERPQFVYMRVAVSLHLNDMEKIIETYNLLSLGYYTHATPTNMNASKPKATLASCFLVQNQSDSVEGIFETVKQCALISKGGGGIGISLHNVRANHAYINSGGESAGLKPLIRHLNTTAKYIDQGRKRNGAIACYLEPHHPDIFDFLDMRKNTGQEQDRARDMFFALWCSDLFMKRVEEDGIWSLMSPDECPDLASKYGEEFEKAYESYEDRKMYLSQVPARKVWHAILEAQVETGTPYMLYKDACNRKSNQKNLGTIQCSNLCSEIIQYSSPSEISVCTLASICLPKYVKAGVFDHTKLFDVVRVVVRNLNRVIDVNHYALPETMRSSHTHRPIGIGVQGLSDTFQLLRYPYESKEAQKLNLEIFETIYFAALTESCALAERDGAYDSYEGSPISQGILQQDMWGCRDAPDSRWNWSELRENIKKYGVLNSLMTCGQPTAGTSQVCGNTESFEPLTSNVYVRKTKCGEFTVVNQHLISDLEKLGLWPELRETLLAAKGSIQNIKGIPQEIKDLYKTVWEMSGRTIVDMSRDRGRFIDQSQSLNLHMANVNADKLTSYHFYAWKAGLKTGMYYLKQKNSLDATAATLDPTLVEGTKERPKETDSTPDQPACPMRRPGDEECFMCSG